MNATILVALAFAALLGLEWRYRLKSLRVATALLALVVLFYAQPVYTRAARRAHVMPPAERVTEIRGARLPEYVSGVRTMERVVAEDANMGADARRLALGVLFWLACSPVFWRAARAPAKASAAPGSNAGLTDR